MLRYLLDLFSYLNLRQKRDYFIVVTFRIIASIGEFISVGAIIPLIAILASQQGASQASSITFLSKYFDGASLPKVLTYLVIVCILLSNAIALGSIYIEQKYVKRIKSHLTGSLFSYYLNLPISNIKIIHSSDIVSNINSLTTEIVNGAVQSSITLFAKFSAALFILVVLFLVQPYVALMAGVVLTVMYVTVFQILKKKITRLSEQNAVETRALNRYASDTIRSIHLVSLNNLGHKLAGIFNTREQEIGLRKSNLTFLQSMPRYFIEMGSIMFAVIAISLVKDQTENNENFIETIALFGIAFFRLLPALQQSYHAYSSITRSRPAYEIIKANLYSSFSISESIVSKHSRKLSLSRSNPISVELKNVSFRYNDSQKKIIHDLSISFCFEGVIAISGPSGAGKSTILKLILGLYDPEVGVVRVGGYELNQADLIHWWSNVSYVPQDDYLIDDSLLQNVTLYDENVNEEKLELALRTSGFDKTVQSLTNGLLSKAGENANTFSGGQRQRLALSRALYQDRPYLMLDEAFSAIDVHSTKIIIENILKNYKYLGLILISHRQEEVNMASKIIEI